MPIEAFHAHCLRRRSSIPENPAKKRLFFSVASSCGCPRSTISLWVRCFFERRCSGCHRAFVDPTIVPKEGNLRISIDEDLWCLYWLYLYYHLYLASEIINSQTICHLRNYVEYCVHRLGPYLGNLERPQMHRKRGLFYHNF